jgi:hypothetical protein
MPPSTQAQYDLSLLHGFWIYAERCNLVGDLDRSGPSGSRPPVFQSGNAHLNLLQNPTASPAQRLEVIRQIPRGNRHRWFGSMRSSQALAQTVFGNLKVFGFLDALNSVVSESGTALLGAAPLDVQFEYPVGHLGEHAPHQTQIDLLIATASGTPVALECKLCETEVGPCSRTKLKRTEPEYCDGTYTLQCTRSVRCSLTNLGISYWEHIPKLFRWNADIDLRPCPLKDTYQLVRNVLATGIDKRGSVQPGHVVVIYDERNPAFRSGRGDVAFEAVRAALHEPERLRKCSWQTLVAQMRGVEALRWLSDQLHDKYGF